jgi:hypothetical protein
MLKKLGIATLVLGGILAVAPPKANARFYFGVGPPVYSYPYAYPYAYPYSYQYGYHPYYGYGWGGPAWGGYGWGWHGWH